MNKPTRGRSRAEIRRRAIQLRRQQALLEARAVRLEARAKFYESLLLGTVPLEVVLPDPPGVPRPGDSRARSEESASVTEPPAVEETQSPAVEETQSPAVETQADDEVPRIQPRATKSAASCGEPTPPPVARRARRSETSKSRLGSSKSRRAEMFAAGSPESDAEAISAAGELPQNPMGFEPHPPMSDELPDLPAPEAVAQRAWWRSSRGWLVSVTAHVALVALLAVASLSLPKRQEPLIISSNVAQDATPIEPSELRITSQPLKAPKMALPDVSTTSSLHTTEMGDTVSELLANTGSALAPANGDAGESAAPSGSKQRTARQAEFFGVQAQGHRFVYLVDCSSSMKGPRFPAAVRELLKSVSQFDADQRFYVFLYSRQVERMVLTDEQAEERPVEATDANLRRLRRWMSSAKLRPGGPPDAALAEAIAMLPDAIFLLSDGKFGTTTETFLQAHNWIDDPIYGERPKVVIHTIGLHSKSGAKILERIAQRYGGQYRFVPPPNRKPRR